MCIQVFSLIVSDYISTFSLPRELKGEGLYYFMQFQSAISFIEKMDASVLNIGAREFERFAGSFLSFLWMHSLLFLSLVFPALMPSRFEPANV